MRRPFGVMLDGLLPSLSAAILNRQYVIYHTSRIMSTTNRAVSRTYYTLPRLGLRGVCSAGVRMARPVAAMAVTAGDLAIGRS